MVTPFDPALIGLRCTGSLTSARTRRVEEDSPGPSTTSNQPTETPRPDPADDVATAFDGNTQLMFMLTSDELDFGGSEFADSSPTSSAYLGWSPNDDP